MKLPALALSDGAAGNERQALALAQAMGLTPHHVAVRWPAPWSWFAPHLVWAWEHGLSRAVRAAVAEVEPRVVIGCGRAAALATRVLRAKLGCFAVQILDPRAELSHWDVVIAPTHDGLAGDNSISTIGALNTITPARLAAAALSYATWGALPAPRTAVLIGGSTRAQRIDEDYVRALIERLRGWHAREGGSFLVTTSRRSDTALVAMLRAFVAQTAGQVWSGEADGPNPYLGMLAHAQRLVVTPDSVNLLSEACATGKPVFTYAHRPVRGKLARFHHELMATGRLRTLDATPAIWSPEPLRETEAVAEEVGRRLQRWLAST